MGRFPATFIASALLALVCGATVFGQDDTIRIDVRLVPMLVSVRDRNGQIISGLNREDFHITDLGVPQEVAVFERQTGQPLSISVLVDTSGSTHIQNKYELDAVGRFFHAALSEGNPADTVSLYTFNDQVTQQTGFVRRAALLESKLRAVRFQAGTSMYDAIYFAAGDLRAREGRHVMIVVTDGGDTTSYTTFQQALEALHRSDGVVYPVLVVPVQNSVGHNVGGENALATFATQTGGRVFYPQEQGGLDAAFRDILRELRTQYLLGFYPRNLPPGPPRFHPTAITLGDPSLRISARTGYYGDSETRGVGAPPASGRGRRGGFKPVQ